MNIYKLKKIFFYITISALALLVYTWFNNYNFEKNPLSSKYTKQLEQKEKRLRFLAYEHFKIIRTFKIIISNDLPNKQYGRTIYTKNSQIIIELNKKRFKESSKFMIEEVFAHEYAHAIMFAIGDFSRINTGHTKKWQGICKKLEGKKCKAYVNTQEDIVIEKTKLFK